MWAGLEAGFSIDDLQVYEGCLEPGCSVDYSPLVLPGLGLGATVGAEVGRLHFTAAYLQGLAYGTVPHRIGLDARLGVALTDAFVVVAGGDLVSRRVLVEGRDSGTSFGELQDTQLIGSLGFGVQL